MAAINPTFRHLVQLPIADLSVSDAFKKSAQANGFTTLQQMLDIPLTELVKMEWFRRDILDELMELLKSAKQA